MKKKEHLFTLTSKDFRVDTFCSGGPGGQNQNKRKTGVRITHSASGAVGESREHRSQDQNKKAAFNRLAESKTFKAWLRMEAAARIKGFVDMERMVDDMMQEKNLKVEYYEP